MIVAHDTGRSDRVDGCNGEFLFRIIGCTIPKHRKIAFWVWNRFEASLNTFFTRVIKLNLNNFKHLFKLKNQCMISVEIPARKNWSFHHLPVIHYSDDYFACFSSF